VQPYVRERQNNFNFLRLIFALLVLLSHAPELADGNRSREILTQAFHTMSFGEAAVAGFFILSGYLIVQSWISCPEILEFLKKRVLRIYPAFIVATAISAFVVGPLAANPTQYFSSFSVREFVKGLVFLGVPKTPIVFSGTPYAIVNGSMWTISYEFKCYLLVVLLGLIGAIKKRYLWAAVTVAILGVIILQKLGFLVAWDDPIIRLASYFFCGGCFFLYRDKIPINKKVAAAMSVALLAGMFSYHGAELAFATAGAYLLFYMALSPIKGLKSFNKYPDVSYGAYLYGWPVQKLLLWYFPLMSPWLLFVLSAIACITLGAISWSIIEKRALSLKSMNLSMGVRRAAFKQE
jgi:peptidoglycan/LPS O-acetylase OafA/YrhL